MTEPATENAAAGSADDAPTTVAAILDKVGDDAGLASAYLEAEHASATPRPTLVAKLEKIAGLPAGSADQVDVILTGASHGAEAGTVRTTDRENALELQRAGLAQLVEA